MNDIRNRVAQMLYEADLDLSGATVKDVVDLLEKVGNHFYTLGVVDTLTGKYEPIRENEV